MLIVDKSQDTTRFIVTVTEATTVGDPVYTMMIHSSFTNGTFYLPLPQNTSPYPVRYDEFMVETSEFDAFPNGMYAYTISEVSDGVVERGVLVIKNSEETTEDQFTVITPDEDEDDFITYNPSI
jgi:hypothetical protein